MVRSLLEYMGPLWSPWKIELLEHIEKVQKRATKMIDECKNFSYQDRLKFLNLPTLKYRRIRGDMILVFKYFMNVGKNSFYPNLILHEDSGTRGHNKKLKCIKFNTNLRKHFFTCRVVSIWNSLPCDLISQNSVEKFEIGLDKYWEQADFRYNWRADLK